MLIFILQLPHQPPYPLRSRPSHSTKLFGSSTTSLPSRIPCRNPLHNHRPTVGPEGLAPAQFLRREAEARSVVVPLDALFFAGKAGGAVWDEGRIAAAGNAGFFGRGGCVGADEVAEIGERVAYRRLCAYLVSENCVEGP